MKAIAPLLLAAFLSGPARAAPPAWAVRDTQQLNGKLLTVVCSGSGPSIGFARQSALDSCKTSAAQHLTTEFSVRSMSVLSEVEAAFQQEILNRSEVSGLACVPRKEQIEERDSETRLWLLCEFDLSKARAVAFRRLGSLGMAPGRYLADERKVLTLAVIPGCTDLIVRGQRPSRIVRCDHNPVSVVLDPGDREITLRAREHLPKSIFLGPQREERGYAQVVLDPST